MIRDRSYKLIVLGIFIVFILILFLTFRFLRGEISQISAASNSLKNSTILDMGNWEKIKHRFGQ